MKTLRVSYGLPRLRCGFSFHYLGEFQEVIQGEGSLPEGRQGASRVWTRGNRGRAGPYQSERSERAWMMAVRVALAGAAAGRLDGLTVHRSPCRWLEVLLCRAALPRVGDDLVSLGCVVETDCGRPPPSLTNTYEMRKPSAFPWVLRRPSRRSWAFPSPQTAMCHGLSGHEPFYQRFVFD